MTDSNLTEESSVPQKQAPQAVYDPSHPHASPDSGYVPPPETRFRPGVSGNPGGRRRGASPRAAYLRELGRGWESDSEAGEGEEKQGVKCRALASAFMDAVLRGDADAVRALAEGINQADGKPQESVALSGDSEGVIQFHFHAGALNAPPLPGTEKPK